MTEVAWHRNAVRSVKYLIMLMVSPKRRLLNGVRFLLATEGRTFAAIYRAFAATSEGRNLLRTQPPSARLLADRDVLAAQPKDALGRCYLEFMEKHSFNEGVYLNLIAKLGRPVETGDRAWFRERWDCCHDLRHVLTGYGPDHLGEICLLAFRYAQTGHRGMLALVLLGLLHPHRNGEAAALPAIREAYRRGKAAELLDLLPWETGLDQPLSAHRARLNLTAPRHYTFAEFADDYRSAPQPEANLPRG